MGKKSDFDCGMIVGARQGELSISETDNLLGFAHAQSLEFAENSAKKTKNIKGVKGAVLHVVDSAVQIFLLSLSHTSPAHGA